METIERDPFQSVIDDIRNNDFEYYPYESEEEVHKIVRMYLEGLYRRGWLYCGDQEREGK